MGTGIGKGSERFRREDIYIDFPFEQVMFRWDHKERTVYRKFYDKNSESGPISHDNPLFNEALLYGDETTKQSYYEDRTKKIDATDSK